VMRWFSNATAVRGARSGAATTACCCCRAPCGLVRHRRTTTTEYGRAAYVERLEREWEELKLSGGENGSGG